MFYLICKIKHQVPSDKEECHKGIDVGKRLFEWTHTSNPGSLVFIVQQT